MFIKNCFEDPFGFVISELHMYMYVIPMSTGNLSFAGDPVSHTFNLQFLDQMKIRK